MKKLLGFVFFMPILCLAQTNGSYEGIQFERDVSWEQVLLKAKQENKHIFIDCSASWCVPCKKMEKEIFPLKNVGDFMSANFVSIHVQLDTSKNDDEYIKGWYSDARNIKQQYQVTTYPTYLFFSPDGKVVHRYLNALPDSLFIKVASNALNPEKQYYTLLNNYRNGRKDYSKLSYLADISTRIGENELANTIATDYLHNYLNRLNEKELLQKKHLEFAGANATLLSSKDKIFDVIYKKGRQADEITGLHNFAQGIVFMVITKEEINPTIWPNNKPITNTPNWDKLTAGIGKKYNSYYTGLVVVDAQIRWYGEKKDRQQKIKYTVKRIDKYGLDTAGIAWAIINNIAYDLFFKYCNNKDTLNKAAGWMEIILKGHPDDYISMDTYANLLYKAGRKEEAIQWEEKAVVMETAASEKEKRNINPEFQENLEKMKKGIPTWN